MNIFIIAGLALLGFGVYQETTKKKIAAPIKKVDAAEPLNPIAAPPAKKDDDAKE